MSERGFIFTVREAVGETQEVFAERVGVGLRSLKRYEIEGTLPINKAALRALDALAKKYGLAPRAQG